jgi:hypothetical protein
MVLEESSGNRRISPRKFLVKTVLPAPIIVIFDIEAPLMVVIPMILMQNEQ